MNAGLPAPHKSTDQHAAAPNSLWRLWMVTGGGLGLLKPAPGSWGTLGAATLYWLVLVGDVTEPLRSSLCAVGIVVVSLLLLWLAPWAVRHFGRTDPGPVVLDEYAGFWVACLLLPISPDLSGQMGKSLALVGVVYLLFRLADILKLPPCRQLEKLPAGWGILLDDIAAGLQVNVLLQIVLRLWH